MSKKQKFDEVADSDELQSLFDSIAAGGGANVELDVAPAATSAPAAGAATDDDDEDLQALFDQVSAQFDADEPAPAAAGSDEQGTAAEPQAYDEIGEKEGGEAGEEGEQEVFTRIGQMTRHVHEALRALSNENQTLAGAVEEIPDARQRLSYIMHMTEQAASRVLNATELVQPVQNRLQADAAELEQRWDQLFANDLSVDEFKALARETRGFIGQVGTATALTSEQLTEIMMAQDFQDLTGQVIKRVVELAQTLESELIDLLLIVAPEGRAAARKKDDSLLNGPVIDAANRSDVVSTQEQVDDLLDSLGF